MLKSVLYVVYVLVLFWCFSVVYSVNRSDVVMVYTISDCHRIKFSRKASPVIDVYQDLLL